MTKKCGVWSAERGERPAEGAGVWGRGGGDDPCVGCKPSAAAGPFFPNTAAAHCGTSVSGWPHGQPARCIVDSKGHAKRFQRFFKTNSNQFQLIPMLSNPFQPFFKKIMRRLMFPHSFGSLGFGKFRSFSVLFAEFRILFGKNLLAYVHRRRRGRRDPRDGDRARCAGRHGRSAAVSTSMGQAHAQNHPRKALGVKGC